MPSKINIIVISIGIFLNYICPISVLSEADQRERRGGGNTRSEEVIRLEERGWRGGTVILLCHG